MRVTTLMPYEAILANINQVSSQIMTSETQIATGNQITEPSDNPLQFEQALSAQQIVSASANQEHVASSALAVAQAASSTLGSLAGIAQQAYALGVQASNPNAGTTLTAIASELGGLVDTAGQQGNAQIGDIYVLGGDSGSAPWSATNPTQFNGGGEAMSVQLVPGVEVQQNVNATSEMQNLLGSIQTLQHAVQTAAGVTPPPTTTSVGDAMTQVQSALAGLTNLQSEFGTQLQSIQSAQSQLQAQNTTFQGVLATLQSASIPQVVANLSSEQTTYQAILQTASTALLPSLAKYLP